MRKVALIYGGVSSEHEVSLDSARSVVAAIDRAKYEIQPILVTRAGEWLAEDADAIGAGTSTHISPFLLLQNVDIAFPLIHGTGGEDGTLQGFLEMLGVPYVGCGVTASAVGMDKVLQKKILSRDGFPVPEFIAFTRNEWKQKPDNIVDALVSKLALPMFIKPSNLGSSVGISKAHDRGGVMRGILEALRYDDVFIAERAVPDAREIECGVIGNTDLRVSPFGEVFPSAEFYDYAAKYDGSSKVQIPADITPSMAECMMETAKHVFHTLGASGMARVDFLVSASSGDIFLNEINTIPGFTVNSMFPKVWEAGGLPYAELLSTVIDLGIERAAARRQLMRTYAAKTLAI
jgi:D-alanine-D-alanine ligase